ncbi:MAG TPA: response regulator [Flavipsychrobacter sp.]|jgi:CheY-like chemotaxis protein|nr:response regulator [Flavipsychrobacter sp.]
MDKAYHFILIDDSKLDGFIGEKVIHNTGRSLSVQVFTDASLALEFIKQRPVDEKKTIVLVDILMPLMTGFDFIEAFLKDVPADKQDNYIINLLSSSINESDLIKSQSYPCVNTFLSKPIKKEMLVEILDKL